MSENQQPLRWADIASYAVVKDENLSKGGSDVHVLLRNARPCFCPFSPPQVTSSSLADAGGNVNNDIVRLPCNTQCAKACLQISDDGKLVRFFQSCGAGAVYMLDPKTVTIQKKDEVGDEQKLPSAAL